MNCPKDMPSAAILSFTLSVALGFGGVLEMGLEGLDLGFSGVNLFLSNSVMIQLLPLLGFVIFGATVKTREKTKNGDNFLMKMVILKEKCDEFLRFYNFSNPFRRFILTSVFRQS